MANIIASPGRYIQGKGVLKDLRLHAEKLGKKFFILVSASGKKRVEELIQSGIGDSGCTVTYEIFNGECSKREISTEYTASSNPRGC